MAGNVRPDPGRGPIHLSDCRRALVNALERCARDAPRFLYRDGDPVRCARRYPAPEDREAAALLAALLAFGRVRAFLPSVEALLSRMGSSPREYIEGFRPGRDRAFLDRFRLRVWTGEDIRRLLLALRRVLEEWGGLEEAFLSPANPEAPPAGAASSGAAGDRHDLHRSRIARLAALLAGADGEAGRRDEVRPRSYRALVVDPAGGSACKRWNLFLRWVARPDDGVDLGLWKRVSPGDLVIPLNVHVGRISLQIGLRTRLTLDWRAAVEVTRGLLRIDPRDPLRFDLPLSHLGISRGCRGRYLAPTCEPCGLRRLCGVYRAHRAAPSPPPARAPGRSGYGRDPELPKKGDEETRP